ncbi:MAG: MoaD/ThiS family protein [Candidatus Latescibacteria bacterium]|nr:MoaD/ThiS family protein [Candidatus Latescibacterota bacterium]
MKVEVRLFAYFDRYLPSGGEGKRAVLDLPESARASTVIQRLGIPEDEGDYTPYVLLVNGVQAHPCVRLSEGDVVSIFPPLAGG